MPEPSVPLQQEPDLAGYAAPRGADVKAGSPQRQRLGHQRRRPQRYWGAGGGPGASVPASTASLGVLGQSSPAALGPASPAECPGGSADPSLSTVSHSYGYGLLDAGAMVSLAKNWTTVGPQRKCVIDVLMEPR